MSDADGHHTLSVGSRGTDRARLESVPEPVVMPMQALLVDLVDHLPRIPGRAGLDLIAIDGEPDLAFSRVDALDRVRRQQHMRAGPPIPGVDDEIAEVPGAVVDEDILDMADHAV